MIGKLLTGLATVLICGQLLLFIGPFFLFGELMMIGRQQGQPGGIR